MGGEAERQSGAADRGDVGFGEVFLAEMQMFRAGHDRRAPVVVDDELGVACRRDRLERVASPSAAPPSCDRSFARSWIVPTPSSAKPRHPGDAVDDGIEAIRIRHARTVSRRQGLRERRSARASISPAS